MKEINPLKEYPSSDLYISAYLHSKGLKLLRIEHVGAKAIFIFRDSSVREKLIRDFYNGEVEVKKFVESLQSLKGAIFNL